MSEKSVGQKSDGLWSTTTTNLVKEHDSSLPKSQTATDPSSSSSSTTTFCPYYSSVFFRELLTDSTALLDQTVAQGKDKLKSLLTLEASALSNSSSTSSVTIHMEKMNTTLSNIVKECQFTVSFIVFEIMLTLKGSMSEAAQCLFCSENYHGTKNDNQINQSTAFISGEGKYKTMFDTDLCNNGIKHLKTELTQDETSNYFVTSFAGDVNESQLPKTVTLHLINSKYPNSV